LYFSLCALGVLHNPFVVRTCSAHRHAEVGSAGKQTPMEPYRMVPYRRMIFSFTELAKTVGRAGLGEDQEFC